ncbi:hypothetical protein [Rhizobium hidalgonense]|uniref:Uncharacterized protein n=1 Tax=Rhizobium hidalgonense TaxID=1538159 RepID=A0ABX4JRP9_9HYPH|nr:hypothetical protein [Rhizobium hidalgonense]PDT21820.1 hypothetical protein CO674_19935 [Rhizobium hidalgonense]PON08478.1 hypothetical protein ATY29_05635 [Rhizobium hidalgonense]
MAKTIKGRPTRSGGEEQENPPERVAAAVAEPAVLPSKEPAAEQDPQRVQEPWAALRVVIIDDAMHPPRLDRLAEGEATAIDKLLASDPDVLAELSALGCPEAASADQRLLFLAEGEGPFMTVARLSEISKDAPRMIEEHRSFLRLKAALESEVNNVTVCDPYIAMPDLTGYHLVLLDYYLDGSAHGGERAIAIADTIRLQPGRGGDQQIVLMSSIETVRELRGEFRERSNLTGSAFAFVGKPDLNERWKIKAHLGMLERARPYAPAFTSYRSKLEEALSRAKSQLLSLVDDLDIGDYAFLQGRALMKDGHPLGDYIFWLLSSQLTALTFEHGDMRERQRELDELEFVGEPFAATEPSIVVANMLHSALVSRDVGPLGPHPRARAGSEYADFPLVQLGDVFLDKDRTKAVVVMSADCDLAFSPMSDRAPDGETPTMLVPGKPVKLKDAAGDTEHRTDGLLHRDEVYRIVWDFGKYRSVGLGELTKWLEDRGFDISNRDRLRPLFALKLQQEFGAHLLRVGPPLLPPTTTAATGRIFVCGPEREEVRQLGLKEVMITRFKGGVTLRVTPNIAGALKSACEDLLRRLGKQLADAKAKDVQALQKKVDALSAHIENDAFWIELLRNVELNPKGNERPQGPFGFVLGPDWQDGGKPRVVLQIDEPVSMTAENGTEDDITLIAPLPEVAAVSGAG